jgi:hypothetical protein
VLYSVLVWYTIAHNLLPASATLHGMSNSRLQFHLNLGSTVVRFEVVISMTEDSGFGGLVVSMLASGPG